MGVLAAWLVEIGLITWRDLQPANSKTHTINGFPLPADFLATFIVFGSLGLVPKDSPGSKAATLAAWAFVVATYLNALPAVLNPSNPAQPTGTAGSTTTSNTSSTTITPGGTS
jgi:hypothetical protein